MIIFAWALVSGCAASGGTVTREPTATDREPPLPEDVQNVLDGASVGAAALVDSSPWGANAVVTPGLRYSAASGRDCRTFTVKTGADVQPGLACRRADGAWVEVRVLQHHGRPLMETRS